MVDIKAKGRLPKKVKERAKQEVQQHGAVLAYQYWAYNMAWDGNDSQYDLRVLKEIERYIK